MIWSWQYSIQEQGTKLPRLEVYKYQIYTSEGGWQVKKGQAQLCNNKQLGKKERAYVALYLGSSFLPKIISITLFYWIDAQCGRINLLWFIHCYSLLDSLC